MGVSDPIDPVRFCTRVRHWTDEHPEIFVGDAEQSLLQMQCTVLRNQHLARRKVTNPNQIGVEPFPIGLGRQQGSP